jgi:hypothetical protein
MLDNDWTIFDRARRADPGVLVELSRRYRCEIPEAHRGYVEPVLDFEEVEARRSLRGQVHGFQMSSGASVSLPARLRAHGPVRYLPGRRG